MERTRCPGCRKTKYNQRKLGRALRQHPLPGSYSQYKGIVEVLTPRLRGVLDGTPGSTPGSAITEYVVREVPVAFSRGAGYRPPSVKARPFAKDYPDGARTDEQGNLSHNIDNNPLVAPRNRIVGRRVAGGTDQALPPEQFDAIAKEGTGRNTQTGAKSATGGDLGRTEFDRTTKLPTQVLLSEKLTPDQLPIVYGHEIGHVVDQLAGKFPTRA